MVFSTSHKHNVDMPAGIECGVRAAARVPATTNAGLTDGSLAERLLR